MIFDVPYAAKVDVVPLRKRKVVTLHLRRMAHVDVPERPKGYLKSAVSVYYPDAPPDHNGNPKWERESFTIYRDADGKFFLPTFSFTDPLPEDVHDQLPAVRQVSHDWGDQQEAEIAATASRMIYSAGVLYRPIPEPYIDLRNNYFDIELVVVTDGLLPKGSNDTLSMNEVEEARARVEAYRQRPDVALRLVHRSAEYIMPNIIVHPDTRFEYTPDDNEILYAANVMLDDTLNTIGKQNTDVLTAWARYRDVMHEERGKKEPDIERICEAMIDTHPYLARIPSLMRNRGKTVREIIEQKVKPRMEEEALAYFTLG